MLYILPCSAYNINSPIKQNPVKCNFPLLPLPPKKKLWILKLKSSQVNSKAYFPNWWLRSSPVALQLVPAAAPAAAGSSTALGSNRKTRYPHQFLQKPPMWPGAAQPWTRALGRPERAGKIDVQVNPELSSLTRSVEKRVGTQQGIFFPWSSSGSKAQLLCPQQTFPPAPSPLLSQDKWATWNVIRNTNHQPKLLLIQQ